MGTTMSAELSLESPNDQLCLADRTDWPLQTWYFWYNRPIALYLACFRRRKEPRKFIVMYISWNQANQSTVAPVTNRKLTMVD